MSQTAYIIEVRVEQTAAFGRGQARAFVSRTAPMIPGATIRGALAAAWRREGWPSASFAETFDGAVRFSPLVPGSMELQPLSVFACKYHDPAAQHDPLTDLAFKPAGTVAQHCGSWGEPLKGGYASSSAATGLAMVTSTRISRATQTAHTGNLFSRETHAEGTVFRGHVVGEPHLVETLGQIKHLVIGGRRSVMGAATVTITAAPAAQPPAAGLADEVVVRSISPTILVDAAGRPSTELASALQSRGLTVDQQRIWGDRLTSEGTGGWHAASRLPKPADLAIVAGATAVLLRPEEEQLRSLLERGLGLRRAEGFGWFEVVEPPVRATAAPTTTDRSLGVIQQFRQLRLTPAQSSWLADQVRASQQGATETVDILLQRPAARNLSEDQKGTIRDILVNMPDRFRTAVALRIEREAGR